MILVNGKETAQIAVNDRGFQYGDGLFETIEVCEGRPIFLEQHLQRLNIGCSKLKIPCSDPKLLANEIFSVCRCAKQAVLKIIITRGTGGRGYRQPDAIRPTRIISLHPLPEYSSTFPNHGINARFCETRLGLNPALAGIKHLNRLEQVLARAEWDSPDIQEGIMLDVNNYVIEGTMTNIFYVQNGAIYTDPIQLSGVAGIIRGIIKNLAEAQGLTLIEHSYGKDSLLAADEVFVSNSIIGIWPVKKIGDKNFCAGNITKKLQDWLTQLKAKALIDA
jgi:4-amino-4-deoxychorismate lyase